MKRKKFIGISILLALAYYASGYLNGRNASTYEGLLEAISSCGNFIQASFKSTQKGEFDYFIVLVATIIVIATLIYSIKYLIKPNEDGNHIKHEILEGHDHGKEG